MTPRQLLPILTSPHSPVAIYIAICIACTLGNTLVVLSVLTYKPLQSVQNYFIVSLALADFLVAICVLPFHITLELSAGDWLFDLYLCHFFLTVDIMLCTSSILNLTCIALDRYWAIKDSIRYAQQRTRRRVLTMIGLAWGLSVLVSVPVIYMNTKTVRHVALPEIAARQALGMEMSKLEIRLACFLKG